MLKIEQMFFHFFKQNHAKPMEWTSKNRDAVWLLEGSVIRPKGLNAGPSSILGILVEIFMFGRSWPMLALPFRDFFVPLAAGLILKGTIFFLGALSQVDQATYSP